MTENIQIRGEHISTKLARAATECANSSHTKEALAAFEQLLLEELRLPLLAELSTPEMIQQYPRKK